MTNKEKLQRIIYEQFKVSAKSIHEFYKPTDTFEALMNHLDISAFNFEIHRYMGCDFFEQSDYLWFRKAIQNTLKQAICGFEKDASTFKEFLNVADGYFQREATNIANRLIQDFEESRPSYGLPPV